MQSGDLLAVMSAGAYGFVMSSNYCSRPRVAEVMVHGDRFNVVKARESFEDLVRGETVSYGRYPVKSRVYKKAEDPKGYWGAVGFHACLLVILAGFTVWYYLRTLPAG